MKISKCPMCNSAKIKKMTGDLDVHLKGKVITVPNIEYHRCEKCGETFTDIENEKRIDAFLSRRRKHAA